MMHSLWKGFWLALVLTNASAWINSATSRQGRASGVDRHAFLSFASKNDGQLDVSDLGLTMEDLEQPLPAELFEVVSTSGYESTSRIPSENDEGCYWVENGDSLDVTLNIAGLRGQPAASLAVMFSTTTATITAFGRPVWSCILRNQVDPDNATFMTEDGADMIPIVQLTVQKADPSQRWGGFIEQIGEDSIL